jgi:hypothetical protein
MVVGLGNAVIRVEGPGEEQDGLLTRCLGASPITEITEIGSVLIRSEQHTEGRKRCARCISMWKVDEEHIRSG